MVVVVSDLDAILLDLDGTILDTTEELCHAVATAANRMAVPSLPPLHHTDIITKYPNLFGAPLEEFHDTIIAPHYRSNSNSNKNDERHKDDNDHHDHAQSTQRFVQFFLEAVEEQNTPCPAFSDVVNALQHLRKTHSSLLFGVATTKPSPVAEHDLTSQSVPATLRPLFSHVQGTDSGIQPKPSPDVLLRCAEVLGVDIRRTVYVGDTRRDGVAAKAAGCAACLTVRRGEDQNLDALGADGLIHGFDEIEDALRNIPI